MSSGFYYLASPYSKFPQGLNAAHSAVCAAAARCFDSGLLVFSPIAHSHTIGAIGGFTSDISFWREFDEEMIRASQGLIILRLEGWESSEGLLHERKLAEELDLPILWMDPLGAPPSLKDES